jgi:hypothetical protein
MNRLLHIVAFLLGFSPLASAETCLLPVTRTRARLLDQRLVRTSWPGPAGHRLRRASVVASLAHGSEDGQIV